MRRIAGATAALGLTWVLAGCGGGSDPLASAPQPAASSPPAVVAAQPALDPSAALEPSPALEPRPALELSPSPTPSAPSPPEPAVAAETAAAPNSDLAATVAPSNVPRSAAPKPASPSAGASVKKAPQPEPAKEEMPELVTARPGMRDPQPARWDRVQVLTQRTVRVHFTSGMAPCTVLDSVRVDYRPESVVVTLYTGSDPTQGDRVCAAVAREKAVDVRLAKPLDGRELLDGAKTTGGSVSGRSGSVAGEVRPQPGAVSTRTTSWSRAEAIGARTVRVYYDSATPPCMVLDRAEVDYAADRVVITLITGRDKVAAGQACATALRPVFVDLRLAEPLAGRRIVDGSDPA